MTAAPRAERLTSLDAFRGITIAAMILVNNPGTWRHTYPWLRHADWNGWTIADLIFPCFLFIAGVAIPLSLQPAVEHGASRRSRIGKILRRTVLIFALGLFLNGFPFFDWSEFRIPGVLQRIALCYGAAALAVITLRIRTQAVAAIALLIAYGALMLWVPLGRHPAGELAPGRNLAAYIDHALLSHHMLRLRWDPEGILSTLPAIATTLMGVLTGHWLRSPRPAGKCLAGLCGAGAAAIAAGLLVDHWFPINKNLWSSSYALFTAGIALCLLALCHWLIDGKGLRAWATPFVIYGRNPLLAYLLSSMLDKVTLTWRVERADGSSVLIKRYLFDRVFLSLAGRETASFLYALTHVLLWLGVMAILYRKHIFVKI